MLKIFSSLQVKLIDAYTISNEPVSGDMLMERAALECTRWILKKYSDSPSFKIFVGPGNNGGDGLVIARHLLENHKDVEVYVLHSDKSSELHQLNLKRLKQIKGHNIHDIKTKEDFPTIHQNDIIVDALYGSGLTKPLAGTVAEVIVYLNNTPEIKISIDIPSGLLGENNSANHIVFKATHTLTFEFPFLSFLLPEYGNYVGEWNILSIGLHPEAIRTIQTPYYLLERKDISIGKRETFSHKGTYGHGLLVAGSYGMMGAAVLSSKACLRTGLGLLTTHIPKMGYEIMQTSVPEAIVNVDKETEYISLLPDLEKYDAIGIGCGIGKNKATKEVIKSIIEVCNKPMVIDADGLNNISDSKDWLSLLKPNTIITPHPGEFDRLMGKSATGYERLQKQQEAAKKNKIIIVLKGAHTSIALPDGNVYFNNTGNPGMATGGSGDVLTGMMLSFLAQGFAPAKAAIMAVYLHGLAADIAAENIHQASLLPSDIIDYISDAFNDLN